MVRDLAVRDPPATVSRMTVSRAIYVSSDIISSVTPPSKDGAERWLSRSRRAENGFSQHGRVRRDQRKGHIRHDHPSGGPAEQLRQPSQQHGQLASELWLRCVLPADMPTAADRSHPCVHLLRASVSRLCSVFNRLIASPLLLSQALQRATLLPSDTSRTST